MRQRRSLRQMPKKKRKSEISNTEDHNGIRISYHEKVCAERMKTLFKAIDEMRKDIKKINSFMNFGRGAAAIIILLGGIIGSAVYFFTKQENSI